MVAWTHRHNRDPRASLARLATLWLVIASTAALAPRPGTEDPWAFGSGGHTRWVSGRAEADRVAWSAGSSTAAACEAMRAARARAPSEGSTAALLARDGEVAVAWLSTIAPPSTGPSCFLASRGSNASPRAPPV